jgi:hypothetical protein
MLIIRYEKQHHHMAVFCGFRGRVFRGFSEWPLFGSLAVQNADRALMGATATDGYQPCCNVLRHYSHVKGRTAAKLAFLTRHIRNLTADGGP